jgi:hypothetical protein
MTRGSEAQTRPGSDRPDNLRRVPIRRLGELLILGVLLIGLGACSGKRDAGDPAQQSEPSSDSGQAGGSAKSGADLPPLELDSLSGQLIAIAASQSGVSNRASSFALSDGRRETLWATAEGGNVSDWLPAPDRKRVAYRMIQRAPGEPAVATESLLVQALEADAPPIELAQADTALARLAGFAWSPEGDSLAYGRQVGGLAGAEQSRDAAAPSWELRTVLAESPKASSLNDRVVWRLEGAAVGPNNLSLAAWDPASKRAALVELAGDSGLPGSIRIVDLDSGDEAASFPLGGTSLHALPSGDGTLLALSTNTATGHELRVIELANAKIREIETAEQRSSIKGPIWSPDGGLLAWDLRRRLEGSAGGGLGASGAADRSLRLQAPLAGSAAKELSATSEGSWPTPLAFSPDGGFLLVGEVASEDAIGWDRLVVHDLQTGASAALTWQLPPYTWSVFWVD